MARIKNAASVVMPAALAAAVLAANVPAQGEYDLHAALFFAALVALLFNLGAVLNEGVISPAPTAALMAYLTLGHKGDAPAALWSAALGSAAGAVIWFLRAPWASRLRRHNESFFRGAITHTARMPIGLYLGGAAYRVFDGRLPLDRLGQSDVLPLAALVAVFLAVYLGLLIWQAANKRPAPSAGEQPWQTLFGMILLPLPFAALGPVAYHALSPLAFGLTITGLLGAVAGVYVISQGQARYRQQVLELSSLSKISQAMHANMDLHALLDVIYRQLHDVLRVTNFTVALVDPSRDMLVFPQNITGGRSQPLPPREMQRGPIEYVIHERKPLLLVDNVPRRSRALGLTPPQAAAYSWLGVPLLAPDRVLGCMAITSTSPWQRFSPDDLHLLTLIAAQAQIAIDNSSLYGQARDRSMQLAMLNNVATILGGSLDLRQILDFVRSSAEGMAGCDAVALYVWWDDARRTLMLARQSKLSDAFTLEPPEPMLAALDGDARRRQPVIVTNSQTDHRAARLRPWLDRERKRAWVELLLAKGDDLLGILVLYYDEPRQFTAEEIELFRNFANLAALAISNARLYTRTDEALQRRVEQLSTLAVVSRDLASTLSLESIYQIMLDRAMDATESAAGALLLRVGNALQLVTERGLDPAAQDESGAARALAENVLVGEPLVIADATHEAGDLALNERMRAHLAVPVKRGDDVLGAIVLGSERTGEYNQDDVSFVSQLGAHAHIAIDNVRLFHRIEEARDRLVIILDSMREGLILVDAGGRITLTNPRVRPLLGLDPAVIGQRPVADLMAEEALALAERLGFTPDELARILDDLAAGEWEPDGRTTDRVTYEIAAPKHRFIDRTGAPVWDRTGRVVGLLMVFTDVTESHNLAQARQELTNMIVHDLRGPLTAVITSLKLLDEVAPPDEHAGQVIGQTTGMASRAVRKLLNLVDSLLDISKMESGAITLEYEPVDLREPCTAVIDDLAPLARELDITLAADIPPEVPLLRADIEKAERILLNLVDNALKYTPAGGSVAVRAHAPGTGGAAGGFIRIDVADTGPGVPDEHKMRLFDRFAQLDGQRGRRRGTGLGLTFCRMAVEAHGGQIWIEDNPQGGAIFSFTLPVAALDEWAIEDEDW
jgi:signal transduction histidine kinase/signal transduction protein with GAF and PtsI domain